MMYCNTFSALSAFLLAVSPFSNAFPSPQPQSRAVSLPLPNHIVHQFPKPAWLENIVVRHDNTILTTMAYPSPSLYLVDPSNGLPTIVHTFPSVIALLGITELGPDTFYVAGGNFSIANLTTAKGSFAIFEVAMGSFRAGNASSSAAQVKKVVDISEGVLLNGATTLSQRNQTILVADSALGVVFKVDVAAATYSIAIDIPELKAPPGTGFSLGVNGIHAQDGWLYFSNTGTESMNRVRIHRNGTVNGAVEVLATGFGNVDDFILDKEGRIWMALDGDNKLAVLEPRTGNVTVVLGQEDQLTLAGPTSCAFGRRDLDEVLFVATNGGFLGPINGTLTQGGNLVAVDTKGFCGE